MSRLLTGLLIQTKHRKRASQKPKKSFSKKNVTQKQLSDYTNNEHKKA